MFRSRTVRAALAFLTLTAFATSCSGRSDSSSTSASGGGGSSQADDCPDNGTDGISGDTITLASSFPQADPILGKFAEISKGWKAYFASVNDKGGVEIAGKKYKIETKDLDDNYDENKTSENIDKLVGVDGSKAFAVFNVVGTANNLNIRKDLDELCVPNIFAATGSPAWGDPNYPWMIGSTLAPYTLEAKMFADYLKKEKPEAKVAMLVQDDDFGRDYEEGFKAAIKGTKITVSKVEKYKAGTYEVTSQVTSLKGSGADTFFDGATLLACPNALNDAKTAGWKPLTFVSGTCISKTLMGIADGTAANDGVFATTNIKDPLNPAFDDDAAMKEYRSVMKEFGDAEADPDNGIVAYGYTQAAILVKVLGGLKTLDRASLMDALRSQEGLSAGLLIDGATVDTSKDDPYMVENLQLLQYKTADKHFSNVGEVQDNNGTTADVTPKDLIEVGD